MTLDFLRQLFLDDPATTIKTGLRFVHFIALALGLGGATLLDLMLFRFFLCRRIGHETFSVFLFSTRIIDNGLRVLWLSGIGFLVFYAMSDVAKLANPKVHAKFVIVTILTLNGIFIHRYILPTLQGQVGRALFDGFTASQRAVFVVSASVSVVSWYVPVALGVFSQLNNTVPALTILSVYLLMILLAIVVMNLVTRLACPSVEKPTLIPGE